MERSSRMLGVILVIVGFLLAVPTAYYLVFIDSMKFIKLIKILFVSFLVILGSLSTATGIILALGWPKIEKEE